MDWFERLTGFRETDYDDTRAKLRVDGSRLRSLVNGKSYGIGELELVSLQTLRERVKSAGRLPGRLKVSVVSGDVRQMHQLPENAGALFQVASQFNLLEMVSPEITPEHGVTRYEHDRTQGPACAIAAGAATIYRNYFAPVGGSHGQTRERQFDGLADLGEALSVALKQPVKALWEMQKRLRAMHPLPGSTPLRNTSARCNRSRSTSCAENCASEYTATSKSPMPQGSIDHWSRRPSARPSRWPTPVCRLLTGRLLPRWFCKQRTKQRCGLPCRMPNAVHRTLCFSQALAGALLAMTKAGFMPPCGVP